MYRWEVEDLPCWYKDNILILNVQKITDMVVDFRRSAAAPPPLYIEGVAVEMVPSINTLSWCINITAVIKRAQQCLYFQRK